MGVMFPQQNVNVTNYDTVKNSNESALGGEGWGDGRKCKTKGLLIFHILSHSILSKIENYS